MKEKIKYCLLTGIFSLGICAFGSQFDYKCKVNDQTAFNFHIDTEGSSGDTQKVKIVDDLYSSCGLALGDIPMAECSFYDPTGGQTYAWTLVDVEAKQFWLETRHAKTQEYYRLICKRQ